MPETTYPAVNIEILGDTGSAIVRSPYCKTLIPIFKDHGGRWQRDAKAWLIDASRAPELEAATAPYRLVSASGWTVAGGASEVLRRITGDIYRDRDGGAFWAMLSQGSRYYTDYDGERTESWEAVIVAATRDQVAEAEAVLAAEEAARDARRARSEARRMLADRARKEPVRTMLLRDFGEIQSELELIRVEHDVHLGGIKAYLDRVAGLAWIHVWSTSMDDRPDVDTARALPLTDEIMAAIELAASVPGEWR